ncbi:MAG: hypothetical protein WCT19_01150 [Candidatus Paceibacterota bacterium]
MKTNQEKARQLAFVSVLLSLMAFAPYFWKNLSGAVHPNISSWAVWSFITVLNFASYKKMTGDWVKSILPTINSCACICTFLSAILTGSIHRLTGIDLICLIVGMIAGLSWWVFKSASCAQIVLQIALVIGFVPTIAGTLQNPSGEFWFSWLLWTASFVVQFFVVKTTWRGKIIDLLYPVNMAVFHGAVFILALR